MDAAGVPVCLCFNQVARYLIDDSRLAIRDSLLIRYLLDFSEKAPYRVMSWLILPQFLPIQLLG